MTISRKKPLQMELLQRGERVRVTLWGVSRVDHFTPTLVVVRVGRGSVRLLGSDLCIALFEGKILEVNGKICEVGLLGNGHQ